MRDGCEAGDADDRDEPPDPDRDRDPDLGVDADPDFYDEDDLAPIAGVPELSGAGAPWRLLPRRKPWGAVELSVGWRRTAYVPLATPPHTGAELWLLATWRR